MKHIYKKAEELGIQIYPYIKERIDNTKREHIIPDVSKMSGADFKEYWKALYNVQNEHAGSYNGWVSAYATFEKLGFKKTEITQGHRTFISYAYLPNTKPNNLN